MLVAFHNDVTIQQKCIERVKTHQELDQIRQHYNYWMNNRGCAIGCTIHSDDYSAYETELGIPMVLAQLEDHIFEISSTEYAKNWPLRFLQAPKVGADLNHVLSQFAVWLWTDSEVGLTCLKYFPQTAIKLKVLAQGEINRHTYGLWQNIHVIEDTIDTGVVIDAFIAIVAITCVIDSLFEFGQFCDDYFARVSELANRYGCDYDLSKEDVRSAFQKVIELIGDKLLELMSNAPVPMVS